MNFFLNKRYCKSCKLKKKKNVICNKCHIWRYFLANLHFISYIFFLFVLLEDSRSLDFIPWTIKVICTLLLTLTLVAWRYELLNKKYLTANTAMKILNFSLTTYEASKSACSKSLMNYFETEDGCCSGND